MIIRNGDSKTKVNYSFTFNGELHLLVCKSIGKSVLELVSTKFPKTESWSAHVNLLKIIRGIFTKLLNSENTSRDVETALYIDVYQEALHAYRLR